MAVKLSKGQLEQMSLTDIALELLKDNTEKYTFIDLFNLIAELLEFGETEREEKLGIFYTSLTLDGRFVILSDGSWDLRVRHKFEQVNPDFSDFDIEEDLVEEEEEEEEDIIHEAVKKVNDDEDDYDDKEDIKKLVIVDEDEI